MKAMDIETALRWAYRQELPKSDRGLTGGAVGFASSSAGLVALHALGTAIDAPTNAWGVVVYWSDAGAPHEDAITIAEAVERLGGLVADMPAGWEPFADVPAGPLRDRLNAAAATVARQLAGGFDLCALLRRFALLGPCPGWMGEEWKLKLMRNASGGPAWFVRSFVPLAVGGVYETELDGWDARAQRPRPGAYQRHYVDPDPVPVARARAEHELWVHALSLLRDDLAGRLTSVRLTDTLPCARPWHGETSGVRVLADLSAPASSPPPRHRRRGA